MHLDGYDTSSVREHAHVLVEKTRLHVAIIAYIVHKDDRWLDEQVIPVTVERVALDQLHLSMRAARRDHALLVLARHILCKMVEILSDFNTEATCTCLRGYLQNDVANTFQLSVGASKRAPIYLSRYRRRRHQV